MLKISKEDYAAMRQHCESAYPHEACGVLLGRLNEGVRVVGRTIGCANAHPDSTKHQYYIAPQELISAQKKGREAGLDVVGFYHSHPDHPARWSNTDLEEAHWFACSYVITSVEAGNATRTQSYVLAGNDEETKRFDDEELEVF